MRRLGCASSLLALSLAAGCGPPPQGSLALPIVGGAPTTAFPEVAALRYDEDFLCSAVLIGPRLLATAGHCVYGLENDVAPLSVAFGPNLSDAPELRAVERAQTHPSYGSNPSNDIAVVALVEDAPVAPVPWSSAPLPGDPVDLTLVGFGDPAFEDESGDRLRRSVQVELSEVTSTALRWNDEGRGTCHGDSGGGAYADLGGGLVLVGVHSEGDPQCSGWGSSVRTDVFDDFLSDPIVTSDDDDDATTGLLDDDDTTGAPSQGCNTGGSEGGGLLWLYFLSSAASASALRRSRSSSRSLSNSG